jgi:hypothetical protein
MKEKEIEGVVLKFCKGKRKILGGERERKKEKKDKWSSTPNQRRFWYTRSPLCKGGKIFEMLPQKVAWCVVVGRPHMRCLNSAGAVHTFKTDFLTYLIELCLIWNFLLATPLP